MPNHGGGKCDFMANSRTPLENVKEVLRFKLNFEVSEQPVPRSWQISRSKPGDDGRFAI